MKPRFWGGVSAIHMMTQGHQLSSECQQLRRSLIQCSLCARIYGSTAERLIPRDHFGEKIQD